MTPETFTVQTLTEILSNIPPARPIYIRLDGEEYNIVGVVDRVTNRVELLAEKREVK